jgi:hypothetical protein
LASIRVGARCRVGRTLPPSATITAGRHTVARQIRILTYNIHKGYCSGNRRFVLEGMRAVSPRRGADLVFLQEIHGRHSGHARHEGRYSYPNSRISSIWPMSRGRITPTAAMRSTAGAITATRS